VAMAVRVLEVVDAREGGGDRREARLRRHVVDAATVDVHLAPVAQRREVPGARTQGHGYLPPWTAARRRPPSGVPSSMNSSEGGGPHWLIAFGFPAQSPPRQRSSAICWRSA